MMYCQFAIFVCTGQQYLLLGKKKSFNESVMFKNDYLW